MRRTFIVTHEPGLVGLGKQHGETFDAEETDQDIQVLKTLNHIEEVSQQKSAPLKAASVMTAENPQPEPSPSPPEVMTTENTEEIAPRRRSTYERSDMTAAKPRGTRR